jgi:hypothetical protein
MIAKVIPHDFQLNVLVENSTIILVDHGITCIEMPSKNNRIIALTVEPTAIIGKGIQQHLLCNFGDFDLILTDQPELLHLPNARLFTLGLPWMQEDPYPVKQFRVNTVVGRKTHAIGHKMRHVLWERQNDIIVPQTFYRSCYGAPDTFPNNQVLETDKTPLFNSQFQICIENSFDSPDYFTEKILDCLISRVVPIYWGAANIGNYFDLQGILTANSVDSIIDICNSLTDNLYGQMTEAIELNYHTAKGYIDAGLRVHKMLM